MLEVTGTSHVLGDAVAPASSALQDGVADHRATLRLLFASDEVRQGALLLVLGMVGITIGMLIAFHSGVLVLDPALGVLG